MDAETLSEDEIQRGLQKIFKRAQTDVAFRTLCLIDPAEAIRQVTGKSLPADLKIQFLDPADESAADPAPQDE
jgi:hypothetical protein